MARASHSGVANMAAAISAADRSLCLVIIMSPQGLLQSLRKRSAVVTCIYSSSVHSYVHAGREILAERATQRPIVTCGPFFPR